MAGESLFTLTIIALGLRCLLDFTIFDYKNVWLPVLAISLVLFVILLIGSIRYRSNDTQKYGDMIGSFCLLCFYAFGATLTLNCLSDTSTPEVYEVKVLDKRIAKGKSTTYYLKLAPWNKQPEAEEISVDRGMYNRIEKEDKVNIYYKHGRLDIPWLIVTDTPWSEPLEE